MKPMYRWVALAVAASSFLFSCQEDTVEPLANQTVSVTLDSQVGAADFDTANTYTLGTTGARVRFEQAQVLLSDFRFVRAPGDTLTLPDSYVLHYAQLFPSSAETVNIGNLPPGNYTHVVFTLGIPADRNTQAGANGIDPSAATAPTVLQQAVIPPDPTLTANMYWNWTSGYIFQRVEGWVDTSAANNGGALTAANAATPGSTINRLLYHTGFDSNIRTVTRVLPLNVQGPVLLRIRLDFEAFLENQDLKTRQVTHSGAPNTNPNTGGKPDDAERAIARQMALDATQSFANAISVSVN